MDKFSKIQFLIEYSYALVLIQNFTFGMFLFEMIEIRFRFDCFVRTIIAHEHVCFGPGFVGMLAEYMILVSLTLNRRIITI